MTNKRLLPLVEGEGDERAVPVLLRRILHQHQRFDVDILKPHRRGELPKVKANFSRFFQAAALERAPVICVLDYDCSTCIDVERDEQELRELATAIDASTGFDACFIVKEFESLFLCDPSATRAALPLIGANQPFPELPESVRDAKGWLSAAQPKGSAYKPTAHQTKLVSHLDLNILEERSPSFQRLVRAVLRLTK
jgi:hypothetical protein